MRQGNYYLEFLIERNLIREAVVGDAVALPKLMKDLAR
jgi:hypothetical protein